MVITPKNSSESNREYAFRTISENIISLDIEPGSMIGEQEIATMLGLSRTPVHEALLELSKSKIVDILPQKGCLVSMIDSELIREARFLRITVETALVEDACELAKEEDLKYLEDNLELQEFYLSKDPDKLLALDNEFHKSIYRICNKMQCHYMVSLMSMHFDRVRSLSLHSVKDLKIVSDHRAIFEAIKKKDPAAARSAFQKHMARFELDWNIICREYKKYIAEPSR
ncbi:MAG: GntR family transcriptional regulator [Clostridiales bacterium]|nr:GntR family transcriptional regulator [Clostridiales bacterium]MBR5975077.1 GntR family transcriptional regulator [Clostridiales bacterium]